MKASAIWLALLVVGTATAATPVDSPPATHVVHIKSMSFSPATLAVRRGERIIWRNEDLFVHTATAQGGFDSGNIAAGASWTLVADASGTFTYTCSLHPTMHGILIVR